MSSPLRNRFVLRLGAGVLALGLLVSCQVGKLFQDGGSDPAAARLEFAAPSNATAGEPLSPAVRVSANDSSGTVDTTFQGTVTLTLGEHPEGAVLRGTRTVGAVHGVATFADLSINRAGTGYTLVATATGVRGATSPAFDVAPAAAARLAFTVPPHGAMVDSVLKPPVQVTAFDTLGNVVTSFAANVTVALAANASGGTLAGTTTVPAASGVATFADLSVNRVGTGYHLTASSGQLTGATSDAFDITAAPPTTGDLTVNATTTGDNAPGSYSVTVDGGLPRTIAANGAGTTYTALQAGDHVVALTDVPANCTASGGASKTVTIPAGGAATAAFTINCTALTGSLTVTTSTTGPNPPSNYNVTVDGGSSRTIQANNGSTTYPGLSAGDHIVALTNVPTNCTVTGGASQTATVPAGGSATAAFTVTCTALIGDLTVSTSTSGSNPPSAYSVTVDGGQSQTIAANGTVSYTGLPVGNHSVQLNGVPANCSVSGLNPRTVTVPAGGTVEASFTISCSALTGTLNVATSTSGDSPDPNGYTFTVDNGTPQSIANSQTIALTVPAGSHTVRLGDVAANCTVTNGTSRTVTVPAGSAVSASFTITCQALTGSVTVTTATTGSSLPTSDYTVAVDGGAGQAIHPSGTFTFTGVSVGTHTVTLANVPSNCSVSGGTSQPVNVTANGNAPVTFNVSCATVPPPSGSVAVTTTTTGASLDPDGYTVTVNDPGGGSQSINDNQTVTFTGVGTGSHTVTLTGIATNCTVTSAGGASQTVTVTANQTVAASFTITCTALPGTLTVSTATSGSGQPSGYTFSVDGGGSQTIGPNNSVPVPASAGSHSVRLNGVPSNCSVTEANPQSVTVPPGGSATASFTITCAAPNQPPTAAFTPSCTNLDCTFTDQSTDPDGSVTGWHWTFGDGTPAVTVQTPSHTYAAAGTYTVRLTVTDNLGASSSPVSHSVTVRPANQPPTAAFTPSCTDLSCSFTDQSTDPDGSVTGWHWTFGDGTPAVTVQNPSHSYSAAGTYTVRLTVTDDQNASSSPVSHQVKVTAPPPPNQPPTADFTASCSDLQCSFTDRSSDPDGRVVSWSWRFGDGSVSNSQNPTHTYGSAGTYTVQLTVTDDQGAPNTTSQSLTVTAPPPPNQPPVVTAGGDQNVLVGALFSLSGASFSDPDHNGPWTVTIDWGDGNSSRFTASEGTINASHTYVTILPATYTLTITVTDPGGLSSSDSKTVKVTTL